MKEHAKQNRLLLDGSVASNCKVQCYVGAASQRTSYAHEALYIEALHLIDHSMWIHAVFILRCGDNSEDVALCDPPNRNSLLSIYIRRPAARILNTGLRCSI